jgi:hypothetical protein
LSNEGDCFLFYSLYSTSEVVLHGTRVVLIHIGFLTGF